MHVCTEQGLYSLVLIIFTALVFWVTNVKVSVHTVAREFIMTKTYVNLMHLNIDLRLNKKKTLNFKFVYRNNLKNSGDNQFVKEKKRIFPPRSLLILIPARDSLPFCQLHHQQAKVVDLHQALFCRTT